MATTYSKFREEENLNNDLIGREIIKFACHRSCILQKKPILRLVDNLDGYGVDLLHPSGRRYDVEVNRYLPEWIKTKPPVDVLNIPLRKIKFHPYIHLTLNTHYTSVGFISSDFMRDEFKIVKHTRREPDGEWFYGIPVQYWKFFSLKKLITKEDIEIIEKYVEIYKRKV